MVIPYLPSSRWYALWLREFAISGEDARAIDCANKGCRTAGKDFARCLVAPAALTPSEAMLLSVAVEGGASILKRGANLPAVRLSLHGNWPHRHAGALEALYGRSPYYQHLIPDISEIWRNLPESLAALNMQLHEVVKGWLSTGHLSLTKSVEQRCDEIASHIRPELSVIDALMRLGPETALGLLSDKIYSAV
jgi:hypothetical protein